MILATLISFILISEMTGFVLKSNKNTLNCQYFTQIAKSNFAYSKAIMGWKILIKQCRLIYFV